MPQYFPEFTRYLKKLSRKTGKYTFLVENMRHIYLGESLSNTARQTNLLSPPSQWSSLAAAAAIVPLRQNRSLWHHLLLLYTHLLSPSAIASITSTKDRLFLFMAVTYRKQSFPQKKEKCREKDHFFRSSMEADMYGKMVSDHHRAHEYGYFASIPNAHIPHLT